jgi:hypothetical protein
MARIGMNAKLDSVAVSTLKARIFQTRNVKKESAYVCTLTPFTASCLNEKGDHLRWSPLALEFLVNAGSGSPP